MIYFCDILITENRIISFLCVFLDTLDCVRYITGIVGIVYISVYIYFAPVWCSLEEKHFHKSSKRYMCSQFPGSGH